MAAATAPLVGYIDGDGQNGAAEIARVVAALTRANADLAFACRDKSSYPPARRVISLLYNLLFRLFFGLTASDANGKPKIMRCEVLRRLALQADDWFLDAEILLKAQRLALSQVTVAVPFHDRTRGRSHVRWTTIFEFLRNIVAYRFGGVLTQWAERIPSR